MNQAPGAKPKTEQLVVGVADLKVSRDPGTKVITFALGSCIGVTLYDPIAKVGGMLHYMLPQPGEHANPDERPFMFATTGIPLLFKEIAKIGARKERLVVCAAGAAEIMNDGGMFAIGQRNRTVMRKIFWKNNIVLAAEDTGGNQARTMSLLIDTGEVRIKTRGEEKTLWSH